MSNQCQHNTNRCAACQRIVESCNCEYPAHLSETLINFMAKSVTGLVTRPNSEQPDRPCGTKRTRDADSSCTSSGASTPNDDVPEAKRTFFSMKSISSNFGLGGN